MLLKGQLYLTSDPNIVQASVYKGFRAIIIDEQNQFQNLPNVLMGSILLPPYQSVMAELDCDINTSYNIYIQHLTQQKECESFICVIIAALMKGINIVLYIPKDEMQLSFSKILLEYISNCFGIVIGNECVPFSYNPNFEGIILSKLYIQDIINGQELLSQFPNTSLDQIVIPKLVYEFISDPVEPLDMFNFMIYFNHLKDANYHNTKFMAPVIHKVGR